MYIAPYHKKGRRSVFSDGEGGGGEAKVKGQNISAQYRAQILQYKILRAERAAKLKILNV